MADKIDLASKVAALIPSVYYDVIARVASGVPFVALLLWDQRTSFAFAGKSPMACLVLLAGAGYVAGLLLTPMTMIWSPPIALLLRRWLDLPNGRCLKIAVILSTRNDQVSAKDAEAGATLAKMQAEATLCQNLLSGFLTLWILDYTQAIRVPALQDHGTGFRTSVVLGLTAASAFREGAYLLRQNALWKCHVQKT